MQLKAAASPVLCTFRRLVQYCGLCRPVDQYCGSIFQQGGNDREAMTAGAMGVQASLRRWRSRGKFSRKMPQGIDDRPSYRPVCCCLTSHMAASRRKPLHSKSKRKSDNCSFLLAGVAYLAKDDERNRFLKSLDR